MVCFAFAFGIPHIKSDKRIGPHPAVINDLIIGLLLGDAHLEKTGKGYRLNFQQSTVNDHFLKLVIKPFINHGYGNKPSKKMHVRFSSFTNEKVGYHDFKTFSFTSFYYFHVLFYKNKVKIISPDLEQFMNARVLAYWICCDGVQSGQYLRICTDSYTFQECQLLCDMLGRKLGLNCRVWVDPLALRAMLVRKAHCDPAVNKPRISFYKADMPLLRSLIKPYMPKQMWYKLGIGKRTIRKGGSRVRNVSCH